MKKSIGKQLDIVLKSNLDPENKDFYLRRVKAVINDELIKNERKIIFSSHSYTEEKQ